MRLREELVADRDAVHELHRLAFGSHGEVVAALVRALRDDDPEALSLVAEEDDEVVGHVLFTRSLLDAPRRLVPVQVLSPLAVAPDRQRRGIGGALITHGLRLLDERGVPAVFLEGDPRFYSRFGFAVGGDLGFRRPSLRIPAPAFQVARLSGYEPWMTGTFVYSATFWQQDCVGLREDDSG
ncbi:GNAT family N-acetyltransferase [Verrucosispora sioxanthis]|uniref:N-acetyltransferase n=1 Tax=Verrucosispora sioxanthis TaxID=2499994 RepID=A0A6M1L4Y0_9ACTN|nr:N-acetyltransferase [Verrucosispora sioxanthis]NEE64500.1 N-acetyltransferase [Verrucosispora sioxanthis]NGM13610.1 N-acetyltransferase [Verrucosispora sioxanthis]